MRKSRHTEIAIEVDQIITVTRRPPAVCEWCPACGSKVVMVTLEEATAVISIRTLALVRMVEAREVHFTETKAGLLRLCLPSLLQAM
jgi:hypothetical protein